jgi:hypothetical protein
VQEEGMWRRFSIVGQEESERRLVKRGYDFVKEAAAGE